jgi:hypothetical protein
MSGGMDITDTGIDGDVITDRDTDVGTIRITDMDIVVKKMDTVNIFMAMVPCTDICFTGQTKSET